MADTSTLSPAAKTLYMGASETRRRDRAKDRLARRALEMLGQHFGLWKTRHRPRRRRQLPKQFVCAQYRPTLRNHSDRGTQKAAAAEILRRQLSKDDLTAYANAVDIPGAPVSDDPNEWLFKPIETSVATHHRLILQGFERTIARDYGRLMIFAPPG